jgi:hypothetical protein
MPIWFDYFAAAGGAVAVVAGVAAVLFTAFLFFFTCLFATGAEASAGAPVVCAPSDNPAVASVKESPSNIDEIFVMMFIRSFCRGLCFFCLCSY